MLTMDKSIDPRSGWEFFRRKELYSIAKQEGIAFVAGCPATVLKAILSDTNINPNKYRPQKLGMIRGDADIRYSYEKEEKKEETLTMKIETVYIETMKMNEVRKFLSEHGVKWAIKCTKPELVKMAKDYMDRKDGDTT